MRKKIDGFFVGIILSVIALIASIFLIILNVVKSESIGVGLGLVVFSILSLVNNIKNMRREK